MIVLLLEDLGCCPSINLQRAAGALVVGITLDMDSRRSACLTSSSEKWIGVSMAMCSGGGPEYSSWKNYTI